MKRLFFLILLFSTKLLASQTEQEIHIDSCNVTFPNTLSENAGDLLTLNCACELRSLNFSLYNKAGQLKYSTTKLKNPLDLNIYQQTKSDGRGISKYINGVYYWVAKYEVTIKGKLVSKMSNGTISIFHEN